MAAEGFEGIVSAVPAMVLLAPSPSVMTLSLNPRNATLVRLSVPSLLPLSVTVRMARRRREVVATARAEIQRCIRAAAPVDRIVAGAAHDGVVTVRAVQRVVAGSAIDAVVARAAHQRVVIGGAETGRQPVDSDRLKVSEVGLGCSSRSLPARARDRPHCSRPSRRWRDPSSCIGPRC